jgi:hypothetical protein
MVARDGIGQQLGHAAVHPACHKRLKRLRSRRRMVDRLRGPTDATLKGGRVLPEIMQQASESRSPRGPELGTSRSRQLTDR